MEKTVKFCRNCHAEVTGEYCANCGQREGRADQRFLDLAGELTGDLFDMDSRVWRTLIALLFRPGHLSAEFIAGRRSRYLPPLRLYLVISFILFLVISATAPGSISIGSDDAGREDAVISVDADESAADPNEWSGEIDLADQNSAQWVKDLDAHAEGKVEELREDPDKFVEAMVDYLPQLMFLLLPLFALLVQFAYLFSGFHYLQHLVFALHFHSFAYLTVLAAEALEYAGRHADGWLFLALLLYLPLALRKTYGSGWVGALGKSLFLYFFYFVMLVLGFAVMAVIAVMLL